MERNIYLDDDLEDFLKEKSDQYKLYPSDKVWNNINGALHPKFKWAYAALTVLLLFTSAVIQDHHNDFPFAGFGGLYAHNSYTASSEISNSPKTINTSATGGIPLDSNNDFISTSGANKRIPSTREKLAAVPILIPAFLKSSIAEESFLTVNPPEQADNILVNNPVEKEGEAPKSSIAKNASLTGTGINKTKIVVVENEDETNTSNIKKVLWGGEPFRKPRLSWQMSLSPTLSYRRLTSGLHEITEMFRGIPYTPETEVAAVNEAVVHRPAFGAEAGVALNYRVSNSFLVKAGLQVSYSRYQLKAAPIKYQQTTLAVTTNEHHEPDSINATSSLMNFSGYGSSWYNNEYYQISMPIGFEWQVLGTSSFKWNVAASAQPVFNFSNNVYLLSTDFKNYAQDPSLVRKFNISAGIETFLSYDISKTFKLQAGPQLRYQLLSSFKNPYPVKEYMVDLGFKVGVTKTLR